MVMIMDMDVPQITRADEEVTVKMVVKTELKECMVVSSDLGEETQEKYSSLIMSSIRLTSHLNTAYYN